MNSVILAATAISLLAVGAVSMSSLAAQQSTSSANAQKVALERDRIAEQVNAYVSAVEPENGGDTKAVIKNTGSSPLTVDHCLGLIPSTDTFRPAAIRAPVAQTVDPGSTLDVTFSGAVTADNVKCVTSKGTVLPVRIAAAAAAGKAMLDPADYIDSFAVTADMTMASTEYYTSSAYTPWEKPPAPAQPTGSLTYHIPVSKPITVSYLAREAPDGTTTEVVPEGSSVQYNAGQTIPVPIRGPTSKVTIKFTPQDGTAAEQGQQLTATVRPSFVEISTLAGNSMDTSGQVSVGMNDKRCFEPSRGKYYDSYVATYSGEQGMIGADDWIDTRSPYCYNSSGNIIGYRSQIRSDIDARPEIVQTYSFPAPKSTVKVTLYYDASVRDYQTNCSNRNCDFRMNAALDLGPGGIVNIPTNYLESRSGYDDTVEGSASYTTTFMLTGLTPGQQVDIPVKLKSNISSEIYSTRSLIAGNINYFGDVATQLFID